MRGMQASSFKVWLQAARPRTLPAAVAPVLVGAGIAGAQGRLTLVPLGLCLAFALLVQIAANLANDYFDFLKGADRADRVGPVRAVAAGLVAPRTMLRATVVVLSLAFACGLGLIAYGGWLLLPVGIVCLLCALAYTGGPLPLAYVGLGDVFVFVFFGWVAVLGTVYVQAAALTPVAWLTASAVGLLAANILVVNNTRDLETDARAGKRTLAVRFGRRFCFAQYGLSLLGAYALAGAAVGAGAGWGPLIVLVVAPWAWRLWRRLCTAGEGPVFNRLLADTARFEVAFGLLLAAGLYFGPSLFGR